MTVRPEHLVSRTLTALVDECERDLLGDAERVEFRGLTLGSDSSAGRGLPLTVTSAGADRVIVSDPRRAFRAVLSQSYEGDTISYAGIEAEDYHEIHGENIFHSARDDSRAAQRESGWL
jgi:hypothetical protein